MKVVDERINQAQKSHDEQLKILEQKHEQEKEELLNVHVDNLIGAFVRK